MRNFLHDFGATLSRAVRLLTFRKVNAEDPPPGLRSVAVMVALTAAMSILYEWLRVQSDWWFNEWGLITGFAFYGVLCATLALLAARGSTTPMSRAIADFAALNFIIGGIYGVSYFPAVARLAAQWPSTGAAAYVPLAVFLGFYAWLFLGAWRAGRALWPQAARFKGLRYVAAVLAGMALVPAQPVIYDEATYQSRPSGWDAARWAYQQVASRVDQKVDGEAEAQSDYQGGFSTLEDTLYRQPALMAAALATLKPSDPEKPHYYLLAAAPYGGQDVFGKEVAAVKTLFDERFGTKGRSLALANDEQGLETRPLANTNNIALALKRMGELMNREKDVLVLFITSHGARGVVSVGAADFRLNQITPDELKSALDNAGIKNRVLVISACHAGSFIPKLEGANTLVMAAAAADRTSFGCGNGREWTYFGDALFNHALREETSFVVAFDKAKSLIARWEFWRNLMLQKPSNPQIAVGAEIEKVLATFTPAEDQRAEAVIDVLRKSAGP